MKTKIKKENIRGQNLKSYRSERGFIQGLLTIIIIIIGIAGAVIFIKYKKQPEQVEQDLQPPLVKVQQILTKDIPIVIHGYGTVNPKVELDIIPEVAGKVVYVHPELKVGGFIPDNETILRIDPRDYELAVSQADAAVANAMEQLEREQAEAKVARTEWNQLQGQTDPASSLVLREPQIRKAQSALDSAKAQLATAELRLERTSLSLDFDILITSESVDLGQYIVTGQPLAKAFGTEAVEIIVPLEDEELAWFDVFGNSMYKKTSEQSSVTVKANFAGKEQTWQGSVVRTTGQVDRTSRMISVVVEVQNPFNVLEGKTPLLPGVFAEILIHGKTLHNALAIPRNVIHEGNQIWVANNDTLHIKTLDIVRRDKNFVYIVSDPNSRLDVITSSLDAVIDGMKVRTEIDTTTKQAKQDNDMQSNAEEL